MNVSRWIKRIALVIAVAAIAVPVAQAGPGGSTEAKGYLRISEYLVQHGTVDGSRGVTKAAVLPQHVSELTAAAGQAAQDTALLAARTEAAGFAAINRYLVGQEAPAATTSSSPGFAWGDAGVGAGITVAAAMLLLLGTAGVVSTRRRRMSPA